MAVLACGFPPASLILVWVAVKELKKDLVNKTGSPLNGTVIYASKKMGPPLNGTLLHVPYEQQPNLFPSFDQVPTFTLAGIQGH